MLANILFGLALVTLLVSYSNEAAQQVVDGGYVNIDVASTEAVDLSRRALAAIDTFLYANCTPLSTIKRIDEAKMLTTPVDGGGQTADYFLKLNVQLMFASCKLNKNSKTCSISMSKQQQQQQQQSDLIDINGWRCV